MEDLATTVRRRIMEELTRRNMSQRELADQLKWSQSKLGKVLTGRTALDVNDMEAVCRELRLSVVEAVRDQGLEFCADMTPSELRILERIRQLPDTIEAIMVLLDVRRNTRQQSRHAAPPATKKNTPRR
jgi:transcriptional regulator with XRE-family HTH domain